MLDDDSAILVFGPAYLDRVVRVDRPLLDPAAGRAPLDRSVDGAWRDGDAGGARITLVDPAGHELVVAAPPAWPGPVGRVAVSRASFGAAPREVRGLAWRDDLGGMGAGYAASLGGTLVGALGGEDDPASRAILGLLDRERIAHAPARLAGHAADWTLLISSGAHGDKLPVGFRGCHAAWDPADLARRGDRPGRVRVVAALPNPLARAALGGPAAVRAFFPNGRNMLDRATPPGGFADRFDVLCCNRGEWADLGDGALGLDRVAVVAVTDGARGAVVRTRAEDGGVAELAVPAFPRAGPIVDTNRAGEAFASALLRTLVDAGWTPGPVAPGLARRAAVRGSAAAALVLGRADFGFPTPGEVDAAVRRGMA